MSEDTDTAPTVIIITIQHQVSHIAKHIEIQKLENTYQHQDIPHKKQKIVTLKSMHSYLKQAVHRTIYFTNGSINIWIKESNDRHQIVGFLRFTSSVNSLEPPVMSIIKPLGTQQSQLISAEYELLDMTFRPAQAKGVWIM